MAQRHRIAGKPAGNFLARDCSGRCNCLGDYYAYPEPDEKPALYYQDRKRSRIEKENEALASKNRELEAENRQLRYGVRVLEREKYEDNTVELVQVEDVDYPPGESVAEAVMCPSGVGWSITVAKPVRSVKPTTPPNESETTMNRFGSQRRFRYEPVCRRSY